ncbi:NmrA family NAD(P)-binding protein [Actinomadura montaniterrae]|uniref:NmrA family NAD(P)-binding protein n=1 Tax=Actinomadura montaniterrae TaxID=1803903 RepID=UPI001CEF7694|nr:NmrA family NAD(P)-binding protein [Actinomadura montaniterrae]
MDTQVDLSNLPVDASAPVMVTGATGYVAGWIVKGLVDAGVTVHAAVRDPRDAGKVQQLLDAADASQELCVSSHPTSCGTARTHKPCGDAAS